MKHRFIDFSNVSLYVVTPDFKDPNEARRIIQALLAGGVDAVQLRSRSLTDREMVSLGREVRKDCTQAGALLLVDNRVDIAVAVEADGVHLGHTDITVKDAREILGHRRLIGVSTHSMPEALAAQKEGADYVSCGPIWATPTKPDYKPVGLGLIGLYRAALAVPFVAIGGINETNLDEVLNAGASKVALVRALYNAANPAEAAKKFQEKLSLKKVEVTR